MDNGSKDQIIKTIYPMVLYYSLHIFVEVKIYDLEFGHNQILNVLDLPVLRLIVRALPHNL